MTCYSDIRILVNYLHSFTWPPTKTYHSCWHFFPFSVRTWIFVAVKCVTPNLCWFTSAARLVYETTWLPRWIQQWLTCFWHPNDSRPGGLQKTTAFKKGFGPFELSSFCAVRKRFRRSERELQIYIYICTGCFTGIFIVLPCASHFFLLVGDKEAFECWWGPWV